MELTKLKSKFYISVSFLEPLPVLAAEYLVNNSFRQIVQNVLSNLQNALSFISDQKDQS